MSNMNSLANALLVLRADHDASSCNNAEIIPHNMHNGCFDFFYSRFLRYILQFLNI